MEETIKGKHEMEETNTIKGIEVIAYKGMNSDMSCRGFQYEIGETYKTDKAKLCECGFHACLNPREVLDYYEQNEDTRYFKVKLSGEITKCSMWDTNVAATEITILEEIPSDKFLTNTEWWKNENVLDLLYWSDGLARVGLKDKYNLIDKQGKIFSEQWFEWLGIFHDGFAKVQRKEDKQYNFIDKDGKFLSEKWFDWVDDFKDGFAVVEKNIGLRNFIGKDGKLLSEQWFSDAHSFNDGLAVVQRGDYKYNFIDKDGNFLSKKWFNWVDDFYDGVTRVQRGDGKFIKIDKTGKLIKNCNRIWKKLIKILQ